ncbi:MAG: nucleotidyltransferase domain-containing protein, partial [Patescibacteria group bacterium]
MNKSDLVSYASNFSSFILRDEISEEINYIILFGSTITGKFDEESDIDIFIDINPLKEKKLKNLLELYNKSEDCEKYRLNGIKN